MWDERPFYFVMKFEFNFVDALGKASALSTVQIDIENTERFDLTYVNEEGEKAFPLMLHASISGAVDRNVFALLEHAYMDSQRGAKPMLPVWLSPTQVRLLPINEELLPYCNDVAASLSGFRVDVDDRTESLGKKIREAEKEWVPYIIVVGEKERDSGVFPVRDRASGSQRNLSLEELSEELAHKTNGLPYRPLPLPYLLSKRPKFRG
jgi:threonyl-tRNA synthetase